MRGGQKAKSEERKAKWPLVAILLFVSTGLSTSAAQAGEDKTSVQILGVKATKTNKDMPDELKSLGTALKDKTGCTGFKVEKTKSGSVKAGESVSTGLAGGFSADVTAVKTSKGRVTLQVKISEKTTGKDDKGKEKTSTKTVLNSKITINAGSAQIFTFGYPGSSDEKLVVVVSAK